MVRIDARCNDRAWRAQQRGRHGWQPASAGERSAWPRQAAKRPRCGEFMRRAFVADRIATP
jgi:hypothetical protein